MTTTVSLSLLLVGIFVVHTILSHLINWFIREDIINNTDSSGGLSVIVAIVEFLVCIGIITNLTI